MGNRIEHRMGYGATRRRSVMSAAALRRLAERWMRLWQGAGLDEVEALHAADFVDRSPAGRSPDRTGLHAGIVALRTASPASHASTEFVAVDEAQGLVTIRWTAAPWPGAPTPVTGIEILRCELGRIVERWGEWDAAVLAQPR